LTHRSDEEESAANPRSAVAYRQREATLQRQQWEQQRRRQQQRRQQRPQPQRGPPQPRQEPPRRQPNATKATHATNANANATNATNATHANTNTNHGTTPGTTHGSDHEPPLFFGEQVTMALSLPRNHVLRRTLHRDRQREEKPFLSLGNVVLNWDFRLHWWPSVPNTRYRTTTATTADNTTTDDPHLPHVPGASPLPATPGLSSTGKLPMPRLLDMHNMALDLAKCRVMASASGIWACKTFYENYLDPENCYPMTTEECYDWLGRNMRGRMAARYWMLRQEIGRAHV
jgi:hypothetical protein